MSKNVKMASKRSLYKPATVPETNLLKEKRRPLAQGRLVSKPAITTVPGTLVNNVNKTSVTGNLRKETAYHVDTGLSSQTENSTTPRKTAPHVLQDNSPKPTRPSASLDLSDCEDDQTTKYFTGKIGSEVLMVDASRQGRSLDDTEVDICTQYVHSPVRVICHTPSKVCSDLRGSGSVDHAAKVNVDMIPSVAILSGDHQVDADNEDGNIDQESGQKQTYVYKSPVVVRESTIAAEPGGDCETSTSNHVLHHLLPPKKPDQATELRPRMHNYEPPSTRSVAADSSSIQSNAMKHYQALMAMSDKQAMSDRSQEQRSIEQMIDTNESDQDLSRPGSGQEHSAPKVRSTVSNKEDMVGKVPSKKKGQVVPSRYMQAAKGPLKATDRTIIESSTVQTNKSSATVSRSSSQKISGSSSFNKKQRPTEVLRRCGSSTQVNMRTPDEKGIHGTAASTPNADGSLFLVPEGIDVSAIAAPVPRQHLLLNDVSGSGDFSSEVRSRSRSSKTTSILMKDSSGFSKPDFEHSQKKKFALGEMNQMTLELLHGRYLQWLFVVTKSRKMFREQEKQAMAQLSSLFDLTEKQNRRKNELEIELANYRHLNTLDETLELQEAGLAPAVGKLPQLEQNYHHLAAALDTTRHHIPTKGIYLPDNDERYLDDLIRALQESEKLLGEISVMTRKQTPTIEQFAKTLYSMEKIIEREVDDLSRCSSMLSASNTMTNQENALKIQKMQSQ